MRNWKSICLLGTAALVLAGCGADDVASPGEGQIVVVTPPAPTPPPPTPTPPPPPTGPAADCPTGTANVGTITAGGGTVLRNCQLSGTITGNLVLRNLRGVIYSLSGGVRVGVDVGGDGAAAGGQQGILTIEPGVVLFGSSGADFLLVNRGSQLFAVGSATQPIIMTSRANIEGAAGADSIGQWGGLVILGRAPINRCIGQGVTPATVGCQSAVEGVNNAFYGGASPADNSGRLEYVQIRYPGFEVAPGNELNGITLAGVGSGTTISRVQVANSSDDGIEWFGGTVNGRYLVLTGNDDDSLDTDFGYRGLNQFVIVTQRAAGGDRIIEADTAGFETVVPRSFPRFANFTFVSRRTPDAILLRGGTDFALYNGVVTGSPVCVDVDGAQTIAAADPSPTVADAGPPVFQSVALACPTAFRDEADVPAAQILAAFNAGTNNNAAFTASLTDTIINGANETALTAFAGLGAVNGFFQQVSYVGAVRNAQDNWYNGWTCGLPGQAACTAVPAFTGQ